jgi:glutamate-5-semialdehyde dehydrogenase
MAAGVREVASLEDPVGEVLETSTLDNGLRLEKIRVPLGVVAVVYEARPNVTIDCAALTIKSGNAILLKGSSYAERTNTALAEVVRAGLVEAGLPENGVVMSIGGGRESIADLATQDGVVDLLIPRGGEGLKKTLEEVATVPVIFAAAGICHVYVHSDANLEMARAVAYNAKIQRPGVCNAAETLLVDSEVAAAFLPPALAELAEGGVELVGDEATRANAGETAVGAATSEDWDTEYLDLKLAVKVVDGLDEAIEHVNRHGSGHSDAIITDNAQAADLFAQGVDSAAVYVNASTRFTDGFEFGMGAEIGVSTQKLHARGPVGLQELTTIKYVGRGNGQVRG